MACRLGMEDLSRWFVDVDEVSTGMYAHMASLTISRSRCRYCTMRAARDR